MNNLEFIDREIKECEWQKKYIKSNMKKYPDNQPEWKFQIDEMQLQINQYKQIKAKLEAWEVVQGTIVEGEDGDGHYCYIETVYFTGKKGEKVKKGLYNDENR